MTSTKITKWVLMMVLTLVVCKPASAQSQSSLLTKAASKEHWQARYVDYDDRASEFHIDQLVAPVVLAGIGTTIMATPSLHRAIDLSARSRVLDMTLPEEPLGDYLQYVPSVTAYALNVAGLKGKHSYLDATVILATSWATMGILVNTTKYSVRRLRPDASNRKSFVSGHTATAFMGAEFLRREYWDTAPVVGILGYTFASVVGVSRVLNNRHWVSDVIAGAGVGILSVQVAYWLFPPLQRLIYGVRKDGTPRRNYVATASPWYDGNCGGASFSLLF